MHLITAYGTNLEPLEYLGDGEFRFLIRVKQGRDYIICRHVGALYEVDEEAIEKLKALMEEYNERIIEQIMKLKVGEVAKV